MLVSESFDSLKCFEDWTWRALARWPWNSGCETLRSELRSIEMDPKSRLVWQWEKAHFSMATGEMSTKDQVINWL